MRTVRKVEYVVKKESDISEDLIYAFGKKGDINVLVRKNDRFYWKALSVTNIVWYKVYDKIEDAIDGVLETDEYKEKQYSDINEFSNLEEFLEWSLNVVKNGI